MKKNKILWLVITIIIIMNLSQDKKEFSPEFNTYASQYLTGIISFPEFINVANALVEEGVQGDYNVYFMLNPNTKSVSIDQLTPEETTLFWNYVYELESNGEFGIPEPASYTSCPYFSSCTITLTQEEHEMIRAAKTAHSIWLDKNNMVNWNLEDYSVDELHYLFAWEHQWEEDYRYIDYHPSLLYTNFTNEYVRTTKQQTLYDLINSFRYGPSTCKHYNGDDGYWRKKTANIVFRLNEWDPEIPPEWTYHAIGGCGEMSLIMAESARNLNIPAFAERGWYGDSGAHASALLPGMFVVNHGDAVYNSVLLPILIEDMLMPWSYFEQYLEPCGKYTECVEYESLRFFYLTILSYNPEVYVDGCCFPETTCEDYFDGLGILQYFTTEDVQNFIDDNCGHPQGKAYAPPLIEDCGRREGDYIPIWYEGKCDYEYVGDIR